jgi:hypothetical protein
MMEDRAAPATRAVFGRLDVRIDSSGIRHDDLRIPRKDLEVLGSLAARLAGTRSPIFCDPENGSNDIARRSEGGLKDCREPGQLSLRTIAIDRGRTSRVLALAREIPGDNPDGVPARMASLRDGAMAMLDHLERFGLDCCGGREPLDQRWAAVRKIPHLRRVSVSPWADAERMAEFLGDGYILSHQSS